MNSAILNLVDSSHLKGEPAELKHFCAWNLIFEVFTHRMDQHRSNSQSKYTLYIKFLGEVILLVLYTVWIFLVKLVKFVIPTSPKSLKDEIILVTGGANGIGREICLRLVKTEPRVTIIIWDIDGAKIEAVVKELLDLGVQKALGFKLDVTDRSQVNTVAKKIREEIGDVSLLFNNVGIVSELTEGWKVGPEHFDKVFQVNLYSHRWTHEEFLPAMIAKGKGHIVETCSAVGFLWGKQGSAYIASKHAQNAYIECIREDIRHLPGNPEINVTLIYPDFTSTALTAKLNLYSRKYPFLHKYLTPRYVAEKTLEGVLRNEEHVYIPWYNVFVALIFGIIPHDVLRRGFDVFDIKINNETRYESTPSSHA